MLGDTTLMALRHSPSLPERQGSDVIDFPHDIQPIMNNYCVNCHDNKPRPGRSMLAYDLSLYYNLAFEQLMNAKHVESHLGAGAYIPRTSGSAASPLLDELVGGHHGVQAIPAEIALVYNRIDSGANYSGTYASTYRWEIWRYVATDANRWEVRDYVCKARFTNQARLSHHCSISHHSHDNMLCINWR